MRKFILVLALVFVAGLLLVGAARALGFPFPWIETPNTGWIQPKPAVCYPAGWSRFGGHPWQSGWHTGE